MLKFAAYSFQEANDSAGNIIVVAIETCVITNLNVVHFLHISSVN